MIFTTFLAPKADPTKVEAVMSTMAIPTVPNSTHLALKYVIGSVGQDILVALAGGSKEVTAVELNFSGETVQ